MFLIFFLSQKLYLFLTEVANCKFVTVVSGKHHQLSGLLREPKGERKTEKSQFGLANTVTLQSIFITQPYSPTIN